MVKWRLAGMKSPKATRKIDEIKLLILVFEARPTLSQFYPPLDLPQISRSLLRNVIATINGSLSRPHQNTSIFSAHSSRSANDVCPITCSCSFPIGQHEPKCNGLTQNNTTDRHRTPSALIY